MIQEPEFKRHIDTLVFQWKNTKPEERKKYELIVRDKCRKYKKQYGKYYRVGEI